MEIGGIDIYLEGGDDEEGLDDAGAESGGEAAVIGDVAGGGVLEGGLEKGVGAHAEGVLEGEVGGEGRQPLPQSPHALRADHRAPAVHDPLIGARPIQL